MTATPCDLSRPIAARTFPIAAAPRFAVGSSMMTSRASKAVARAMATACCWPPEIARTGVSTGGTRRPSRSMRCVARSRILGLSTNRDPSPPWSSSRPRKMFWVTESSGTRAKSWYTISMPAPRASMGVVNTRGRPSSRISPVSAVWTPDRIFMRVDFPAALSPTRPTTSPAPMTRETSRSATIAPKRLETFRISTRGAVMARLPARRFGGPSPTRSPGG